MKLVISANSTIDVQIPMSRVIQKLNQKKLLTPTWMQVKHKWGTRPEAIISEYESIARGLLNYYSPRSNRAQLVRFLREDFFHSTCNNISIMTRVPPHAIPKTFSAPISQYNKSMDQIVESMNKKTPAFESKAGNQGGIKSSNQIDSAACPVYSYWVYRDKSVYVSFSIPK
uniref:Domain X domain-containing protein n=1 Tax=Picea glauca TaxID=3330 RepID=A0A117NI86_PICGL|nr:hypothetical protein ABT39_MTgene2793 [Picea glauca]QHR89655.1 hypothetical protein Q903MT_gene3677 [Picea sitchensis]